MFKKAEEVIKNMQQHQEWINSTWEKIEKKMSIIAPRSRDKIPYTTIDGTHDDKSDWIDWWTNGFWAGMMWILYDVTKNDMYKEIAEISENKLDRAIEEFVGLHHDVGFMWLLSAVANYRLTGNERSKVRGLHVANTLAGRFNTEGNFIRAWNDWGNGEDHTGWAIIDCMMNLPLLYWASKEENDPRFTQIAKKHADTVIETFVRPDGSVKHVVEFDPETGEYVKNLVGQSFAEESSWTRGQAWAVYGFVLSYIYTGKQEYLDTAKRIAHYFIAALPDDYVPPCDFRSPKEPEYKDTTAGVCTACGLIEIARNVPEYEKELYLNAAIKMLKAIGERYCNWSNDEDSIVQMGTEAYHYGGKNIPIIYGDYYFIEAIYKLKSNDKLFW